MQFNICIDQVRTVEWGLSLSEATLFSFIFNAGTWANQLKIIDSLEYRFLSRHKLCDELPAVTSKPDTMYRLLRSLHKKGVIMFKKWGQRDMVHVTEKGRVWGQADSKKISPETEKIPGNSEKNPCKRSEKIPTDHKTINTNQKNQISDIRNAYALEKFDSLYLAIPNKSNRHKAQTAWLSATKQKSRIDIAEMAEKTLQTISANQHRWQQCINNNTPHFAKTLAGLISEKPWLDDVTVQSDPYNHNDTSWATDNFWEDFCTPDTPHQPSEGNVYELERHSYSVSA